MKKIGIFIFIVGIALFVGYILHQLITFLFKFTLPIILEIAIILILSGFIILLFSLIFEKIKKGKEEGIDKF
ncbi:MAG TPA: hypothetical protein PKJ39_01180 [Caldisericia bacterium]|nr:hypothetical protein [Caldisericia bacterium]HQL66229.1 hypothetical protein [Caldisericia bacterium]